MSYNYLATLRLQPGGCLTVGPERRVVFHSGILPSASKSAVKSALKSLGAYWSKDQHKNHIRARESARAIRAGDPPYMSFVRFRIETRELLQAAGLLDPAATSGPLIPDGWKVRSD